MQIKTWLGMFHSHMLACFCIGFWIFMLLQKGRILYTLRDMTFVILFTSPCSTGPLNSLYESPAWSKTKWLRKYPSEFNSGNSIKAFTSLFCFHFHMLQRMILGIISAIKTFMGDYLEQFNSNITNQLKTGFLICFLEEIKWIFVCPHLKGGFLWSDEQ